MPARRRAPVTPSLTTSIQNAPSARPSRTSTWRRLRVLVGVAHRLDAAPTAPAARSSAGTSAGVPSTSDRPRSGMGDREPLHLGGQRRPGGPRRTAQRALERRAQVGERRLRLGGAALARRRGQLAVAVERHRDAEQALDDALVDLAREVDALLELAGLLELGGDDPRHRRERRGLAERPQQAAVGVVQRRARASAGRRGSRRRRGRPRPSARTPAAPARRRARANSSGTWPLRSPTTSTTWSSRSACAAIGADSTVT